MNKNIEVVNLEEVMPNNYLEYIYEVIVNRSIADVRDGLKPVHRRTTFGMSDLGIVPEKPYKKCARIVGEVLGKYHPHGDSSVYDALVRMAQDFSLRYPLVDGHGNFGSIDGDSAAAMRYTEAKMSKIAMQLVRDINKNTVDFIPNFDGEEKEPSVLPSRFPNLLVNGSSGIAVGFASNMPPHNLGEVIEGINYRIDNNNCSIDEIMQFIKAPDFPTGGIIANPNKIKSIYQKGEGSIIIRAKHHIEYIKEGNKEIETIVFTELPYQVNKAKLIESMVDLISDREITKVVDGKKTKIKIKAKIPEISDLRDESDREGMRVVIELKKKGDSKRVLQLLCKYTKVQTNFGVNNVALVNGLPKDNISLIELIDYYIEFQKEIITRRTIYDLDKASKRQHILEGLLIALKQIDEVISIIKKAKNKEEAKNALIKEFNLSEQQTLAILEMRLRKLSGLEQTELENEYKELTKNVEYLNSILNSEEKLSQVIKDELNEIKEKFGDERRTQLVESDTSFNEELLIEDYNTIIQLTDEGYIKKLRATSVKSTNKNRLKENDFIIREIKGTNKDTILLFSNLGKAYKLKANQLKELKPGEIGELISSYYDLENDEKITNIVSTQFKDDEYMITVFDSGKVAKVDINSFKLSTRIFKYNHKGVISITNTVKDRDIFLLSDEGKALVLNTERLNIKSSRNTQGVVGIKLNEGFKCIAAIVDATENDRFTLYTEKGKELFIMLDDVSSNSEKNWFNFLTGRPSNGGSFIYNTRSNNDKIKYIK